MRIRMRKNGERQYKKVTLKAAWFLEELIWDFSVPHPRWESPITPYPRGTLLDQDLVTVKCVKKISPLLLHHHDHSVDTRQQFMFIANSEPTSLLLSSFIKLVWTVASVISPYLTGVARGVVFTAALKLYEQLRFFTELSDYQDSFRGPEFEAHTCTNLLSTILSCSNEIPVR